jgi:hypothetical protein
MALWGTFSLTDYSSAKTGLRADSTRQPPPNRHPCCESTVVTMAPGCHHACDGEASPNEGDVETDCHLPTAGQ